MCYIIIKFIDHYRFTGLQNDHKELMKEIEAKLYQIHDCARKTQTVSSGSMYSSSNAAEKLQPFLKVNQVVTASPAAQAVSSDACEEAVRGTGGGSYCLNNLRSWLSKTTFWYIHISNIWDIVDGLVLLLVGLENEAAWDIFFAMPYCINIEFHWYQNSSSKIAFILRRLLVTNTILRR